MFCLVVTSFMLPVARMFSAGNTGCPDSENIDQLLADDVPRSVTSMSAPSQVRRKSRIQDWMIGKSLKPVERSSSMFARFFVLTNRFR